MAEAEPLSWDKSLHRTELPIRSSTNHEEAGGAIRGQYTRGHAATAVPLKRPRAVELETAELIGQLWLLQS